MNNYAGYSSPRGIYCACRPLALLDIRLLVVKI